MLVVATLVVCAFFFVEENKKIFFCSFCSIYFQLRIKKRFEKDLAVTLSNKRHHYVKMDFTWLVDTVL